MYAVLVSIFVDFPNFLYVMFYMYFNFCLVPWPCHGANIINLWFGRPMKCDRGNVLNMFNVKSLFFLHGWFIIFVLLLTCTCSEWWERKTHKINQAVYMDVTCLTGTLSSRWNLVRWSFAKIKNETTITSTTCIPHVNL